MRIALNGKEEFLEQSTTIKEFIAIRNWDPASIVVELNLAIVGREDWANIVLRDNDQLEILRFVGGGGAV